MIKLTSTPAIMMPISAIVIVIFTLSILYFPIQITSAHHIIKEIAVTERPMMISLDEPLLFVSNLGKPCRYQLLVLFLIMWLELLIPQMV